MSVVFKCFRRVGLCGAFHVKAPRNPTLRKQPWRSVCPSCPNTSGQPTESRQIPCLPRKAAAASKRPKPRRQSRNLYRESPTAAPAKQKQSQRQSVQSRAAASTRPSGDPTESHQVVRLPRKAAAASKRPNHRGVQRRPRRQSRQRASDRLSGCRAVDRDKLI